MTPFYSDDWLTLYGGDCREVLAGLPADSVDCVVTSPPYWGLRDYGTATWEGGDVECDHIQPPRGSARNAGRDRAASGGTFHDSPTPRVIVEQFKNTCGKCGATRIDSQLGLERTPEEYVANMVAVFREVRRVLKPSGTCWLNLGDSYAGSWGNQGRKPERGTQRPINGDMLTPVLDGRYPDKGTNTGALPPGLKPKDLVGIPWRVAFALQEDGWYLRSDVIWSKPNPMPESVTDRPTKSHEYLFLLTKSARYYFDADAVREPIDPKQREWRERYRDTISEWAERHENGVEATGSRPRHKGLAKQEYHPGGRNIRSVWSIATRPYPGAHFAVFPPELPERCIKAGSSEKGVCPECGAPWERVVERTSITRPRPNGTDRERNRGGREDGFTKMPDGLAGVEVKTTGWNPACRCGVPGYINRPLDAVPAVILDPFGGSDTVGMVANRLSRRAILIDLNPEYLKQQMRRNAQTPLGLTEGDAA